MQAVPAPFTVLLVPSDRLDWVGLRVTLKTWREVRVRDIRHASEAAGATASQPRPAAIFVAADLADPPLITLVGTLHNVSPTTKILVVGAAREPVEHAELRKLGSTVYVEWADLRPEVVQPLLTTVLRSNLVIESGSVLQGQLIESERVREAQTPAIVLTADEQAILNGLGSGPVQREIAKETYMSVATVERIVAALRAKLGVRTTYALCAKAGRLGLLE